jgi:hypothetical protein
MAVPLKLRKRLGENEKKVFSRLANLFVPAMGIAGEALQNILTRIKKNQI